MAVRVHIDEEQLAEQPRLGPVRRFAKRGVDLSVALIGVVVTAPLVLVLLIGSVVAFRTNPLFVQHRVGRNGRLIAVPKVRSLSPVTPRAADKHQLYEYEVTRWGRFLRRTHLDELPQLWSVVAGHMSLVGPRPEMPHLAERFDPEFAELRHTVRPGITGLWQISEAAAGLIAEAPEWDLVYLHHAGARLDTWVLVRTLRLYLPGGRAITADDLPAWVQVGGEVADDLRVSTVGAG